MFRKTRIKYASKFGKIEHFFGRLIAIPIVANILYTWKENLYIILYISIIIFIMWAVYLTAHTFEKKIYGKHGFR